MKSKGELLNVDDIKNNDIISVNLSFVNKESGQATRSIPRPFMHER